MTTPAAIDDARAAVDAALRQVLHGRPPEPDTLRPFINHLNQHEPNWIESFPYDVAAGWARSFVEGGVPIPPPLDRFTAEVLAGDRKRKERGPRRDYERDAAIVYAVHVAKYHGLPATRNPALDPVNDDDPAPATGCDLVSGLLQELGYKLGYKAVVRIWRNRQGVENRVLQELM